MNSAGDDDAMIEDEDDVIDLNHPQQLVNQTPLFLVSVYNTVISIIQTYGWFILAGIILFFILRKHFQSYFFRYRMRREQELDLHRYDMTEVYRRQEAIDAARRTLQESYNAQAAKYAEEKKRKEEEKRKEKIKEHDRYVEGKGYRSKHKPSDEQNDGGTPSSSRVSKNKPTYRQSEYNPLTGGGGGGASFRPARSGGVGGRGGG